MTESIVQSNNSGDGNRFGAGIEFREGSPIWLLEYRSSKDLEFGQIILNQKALDILKPIAEPLAIISVVGSYRRGKSWFANVLHGRYDGFKLGAEVEGCTRGIFMWDTPFILESKQPDGKIIKKRVIVLDSEGIDDPKQDQNWATKLFILCLAISSAFIYNINGIIGRDDIGKLCLMTDLSNFIQEPEKGDFLPRLVILLRDFNLRNPDNFKDYFIEKLNSTNHDAAIAIKKFFCDFDVYGLSLPGCKKQMLQRMEEVKTNELDEDFVEEVRNAVKAIYAQLPLKFMGSSVMRGMSFVKFLQNIVERMNSSKTSTLLSIPSEYDSVIQFVAQEAINEAVGRYKEEMANLVNEKGKLPMPSNEFDEMHKKYVEEIEKSFFEKIIGNPTQIEIFAGQLRVRLTECNEGFKKKNSEELVNYHECLVKDLWETHVKVGLNEENLFKDGEEFEKAIESFEGDYVKLMKRSPEAIKVIATYRESQLPFATSYLTQFGGIKKELAEAINTKEELVKLQLEAMAREEQLRGKIETMKHEHEVYQRNVEIKMLELQNNIEQQKRSTEGMKIRLDEEKNRLLKVIYDQSLKYSEQHQQSEKKIRELEKELRKNRKKQSKDSESDLRGSELSEKSSENCYIT